MKLTSIRIIETYPAVKKRCVYVTLAITFTHVIVTVGICRGSEEEGKLYTDDYTTGLLTIVSHRRRKKAE